MCVRTEGGAGGVLTGAVLLQDGLVQGAAQDVPLQRDNVGYRQGLPATLPRTGGPAGPADTWRCPRCSDSPARHCSLSCRRGTRGNSEAATEAATEPPVACARTLFRAGRPLATKPATDEDRKKKSRATAQARREKQNRVQARRPAPAQPSSKLN